MGHGCRSTLPPYHYGTLHWGLAHVLAFAGAVLGGVGGWAYAQSAHGQSRMGAPDWIVRCAATLLVEKPIACACRGYWLILQLLCATPQARCVVSWQIGLILFLASSAGCMLLPALIIVPAHLIRLVAPCLALASFVLALTCSQ